MAEWTAEPADLGWLLDEYKDLVERRLQLEQQEQRCRARLNHIASLCRDLPPLAAASTEAGS